MFPESLLCAGYTATFTKQCFIGPIIYSFIFMIRFHNTTFNTSGEDFPLEETTPTENGSPKCLASGIKQGLSTNTL